MRGGRFYGAALLIAAALTAFSAGLVPLPAELFTEEPQSISSDIAASAGTRDGGYILSIGDTGDRVAYLQARLGELGFYRGELDGAYGLELAEAVRLYQSEVGIAVSGEAGILTLNRLGLELEGHETERELVTRLASAVESELPNEGLCARVAYAALLLRRGGVISGSNEPPTSLSVMAARAAVMGMDITPKADSVSAKIQGDMYIRLGKTCFYKRQS